jgi:hypothetical protein
MDIARATPDVAHAAPNIVHTAGRFPRTFHYIATPDLLLKYPDATVATYKKRQMKHLKQASKILVKTS